MNNIGICATSCVLSGELTGAGEWRCSARFTAVIPTGHERESS